MIALMLAAQFAVHLVDFTYAPGAASKPHAHECPATVYIVSGAVKSQVGSGPLRIYSAGTTYHEPAHAMHRVSANASRTKPARFIAFFVCEDHQ